MKIQRNPAAAAARIGPGFELNSTVMAICSAIELGHNNQMTLNEARAVVSQALLHCSDSPELDADCLICETAGVPRARLYSHPEQPLSVAHQGKLMSLVQQRARGMPIAYLLGKQEFWSLDLEITDEVMIPRPATELLVELCLARCPESTPMSLLDLGTGSGAIAIALACERPQSRLVATDISSAALNLARRNARNHQIDRIEFIESDWYARVPLQPFSLIVSNPPYIADADTDLQDSVRQFEPALALFADDNGLAAIHRIVHGAHDYLTPGGHLLIEHGWRQAEAVHQIFVAGGFEQVENHLDLAGAPRVTSAVMAAIKS